MQNKIKSLYKLFKDTYNEEPELLFVSHGRIEIIGNHTDHNHGKCMSARCDKAIYTFVKKNDSNIIQLTSEGHETNLINLNDLKLVDEEAGTSTSLIKGVASYLKDRGYNLCSFNALSTSTIPSGSGLSSSAAFETLICNIFNHYANGDKIDKITIAKASQYAENVYFKKACGLLDQISVVYPAIKYIDFKNIETPIVENHPFPFDLKLILVNTKGSHVGLDKEYSSIPELMLSSAKKLGVNFLNETDLETLNNCKNRLNYEEFAKSLHFFEENKRVVKALEAIQNHNEKEFLKLINESCLSSKNNLKNTMLDTIEDSPQEVIDFVSSINPTGACKINGGGFKGTVVIYVQKDKYNDVKEKLLHQFNDRVIEVDIDNNGKDYYSLDEINL